MLFQNGTDNEDKYLPLILKRKKRQNKGLGHVVRDVWEVFFLSKVVRKTS